MNQHIFLVLGIAMAGLVHAASTGLTRTYSALVEAGTLPLNSRDRIGIGCWRLPQQTELRHYFRDIKKQQLLLCIGHHSAPPYLLDNFIRIWSILGPRQYCRDIADWAHCGCDYSAVEQPSGKLKGEVPDCGVEFHLPADSAPVIE